MIGYIFLAILVLIVTGFYFGRRRSVAAVGGRQKELHSRPDYHGAYVAAWVGIPSLLLVLTWLALQGPVINLLLERSLPAETVAGLNSDQINLLLSEIRSVAAGNVFGEPTPAIEEAAQRYRGWQEIARYAMVAVALSVAMLGLLFAGRRISPSIPRAAWRRAHPERAHDCLLAPCHSDHAWHRAFSPRGGASVFRPCFAP